METGQPPSNTSLPGYYAALACRRGCCGDRERQEQGELKKQDIWQGTKSRFQKVEPLDDALQILIDYGYIRVKEEPEHEGKGRRKAPTYEVNPLSYKSYKYYKSSNDTQNSNSSICSISRSTEPEAENSNLLEVRI